MVAGLATGRPELVVLAVPFLVLVGVGVAGADAPRIEAETTLERTRVLEGDAVGVTVRLRNRGRRRHEVELAPARPTQLSLEPAGPVMVSLGPGANEAIEFTAVARRWGAHPIGPVAWRARDALGIATWAGRQGDRHVVRAFPREQRLLELVAPSRTQPFLGTHVARTRREGIEFADIRPFAAGDRIRHVNWRATAKRGALHVTERHPESASDVVLLLDTFAEARDGSSGTLDDGVRAAASLARAYLAGRDRVALVDFGANLQWLEPAFGTIQLYRIIDALLSSDIAFSYAWRAVESIPRRVLPPGALILAVTPLLDERSIGLLAELRRRGSDVAVVEVSPLPHAGATADDSGALAGRLWRLQREALRSRLREVGVAVAAWEGDNALEAVLSEVSTFRRLSRHAPLA